MTRHTVQTRIVRVLLLVGLVAGIQSPTIIEPPVAQAQQSPFLTTPYYGTHAITAYVDHDGRDNYILLYDGRTANYWNGVCGYIGGEPRAYYTQPNSQGDCLWYDGHNGTDFNLSYERVLAAASGRVVHAGWQNTNRQNGRNVGYGLYIRLSHTNGYETRYGHMSAIMDMPNEYTSVDAGDIIGTSGNTGVSTGPHLHFEVRHNGTATDPFGGTGSSWLWVDGQWAGHPLPSPAEAESITIDDGDAGFSKGYTTSTNWSYATDAGYNGDTYYCSNTTSSTYYRWAKWELSSTAGQGVYEVMVHVPSNHATTWWAKYTIRGSYTAIVDQAGLFNGIV